jgi:hypothetical protein
LRSTGPDVFQSAWSFLSSAAVASQSVDSARASARTQSASFCSLFLAHWSLRVSRSSLRRLKKASQELWKRSQSAFAFARGEGPIVFHSAWRVCSSWAVFTQSVEAERASARAMRSSFFLRFAACSAARAAKKASQRARSCSRAALNRCQSGSPLSLGTAEACFQATSISRSSWATASRSSRGRSASARWQSCSCTARLAQCCQSAFSFTSWTFG